LDTHYNFGTQISFQDSQKFKQEQNAKIEPELIIESSQLGFENQVDHHEFNNVDDLMQEAAPHSQMTLRSRSGVSGHSNRSTRSYKPYKKEVISLH
jgi:hypothetical protein